MTLPSWLTAIKLPMPATFGAVNVYLIKGPSGAALIDTGMRDRASFAELGRQLEMAGLNIAHLQTVVCTHHHADHAGYGGDLLQVGAALLMSREDADSLIAYHSKPEVDGDRAIFWGQHAVPPAFRQRIPQMFAFFRNLAVPFVPTATLSDGQEIDLGGLRFTVLSTPGHTAGHICLIGEGLAFTGDCVTQLGVTQMSMRQEISGRDPLQNFLDSLQRLAKQKDTPAFSGHGAPIADLALRAEQVIAHHLSKLDRVLNSMRSEPRTAYEVSAIAMGPRPKVFAEWLAMSQALAYLEHLVLQEKIREVEMENGIGYVKA